MSLLGNQKTLDRIQYLLMNNKPLKVFNNGEMIRDFTFIDDIVESLIRLLNKEALPNEYFDKKRIRPIFINSLGCKFIK